FFTSGSGSDIPEILNSQTLSIPVKEQIAVAYKKARRKATSENLGMLGMVYHSSANYAEAAKCYELAIQKNNTEWIWNYYNGYLNLEMGNPNAVIDNFKRVTELNPDANLAWYYLGGGYKNLNNNELAEDSYNRITSVKTRTTSANTTTRQGHFPLGIYAGFELSRIYFDSGRTDLAEQTLDEIIRTNNLFGPSYKLLGTIYNLKGDSELGKKLTDRANDLVDFYPPVDTLIDKLVLLSRSELYLLKKIDEAEKSFHSDWALKLVEQGMQYLPDNKYLLSKAIRIYLWKNQNDKAIALTDKQINLFHDDYSEIKNTGVFFYQKGIYQQAVKYWTRALELKPGEVTIQDYLAKSLWAVGEKQKSLDILNEMAENNQENVDVMANVADILFQFGQKEKAAATLAILQNVAPNHPKVLKMLGETAENNGELAKAISLYEKSFKGDPMDTQTIRNLSDILKRQKMWGKYIGLYQKVLEFHPNNPDYLARLGEMFITCPDASFRNMEEGKEFLERAFTHYNCPPDILVSAGSQLAYAYSMLGDKQKAITTVSQTINIARRQNIPASQQAKLETMLRAFQQM
ncbi:MAG TPA: tetratricopeptide repeat protein, partial [Draconibacterium sp.]|nr:tetratricopeptide repeat protein [Draconibacterium sp.]